ncbi:MAG: putative capsular polysaccharide synthesis family protein [Microthrixaceae bacterium]
MPASLGLGPLRSLRHRSAAVDRFVTRARLEIELRRCDPVVVYAMGNTGTTSIASSIETATARPVVKVHVVSRAGIDRARPSHGRHAPMLWRGEHLRSAFRRGRDWTLVCSVRDPVARAVSVYFSDGLSRLDPSSAGVARHVEELTARDWFDDDLKATTGIDVYASPFDPAAGCATYHHGHFRVLLLRLEDLRRVGPAALAAHLGATEPIPIVHRNEGARKGSGAAYEAFRSSAKLPRELVEAAYRTRPARHFYSGDELAAMTERWCG